MGFVYIVLVVLGITSVAWLGKLSAKRGVHPFDLTFVLFFVGTILGCLFFLFNSVSFRHFTPQLFLISAIAGIGGSLAVFVFNHALRMGHFGFSNAIYRSSFLVPVVYGILFLTTKSNLITTCGIACIFIAIFLISLSNESFSFGKNGRNEFKWFLVIFSAFLLSGLPRIGQLLISVNGLNSSAYLFASYAAGFIVMLVFLKKRSLVNKSAWIYGSIAAIASFIGVFCTIEALKTIPSSIVFPVTLSVPIILGIGISYFYREKIRSLGITGILLGVIGIVILALQVYNK